MGKVGYERRIIVKARNKRDEGEKKKERSLIRTRDSVSQEQERKDNIRRVNANFIALSGYRCGRTERAEVSAGTLY